jgi:hypothetical protein
MLKQLDDNIKYLNTSKAFAAFIMILMNIGSRYVNVKFSDTQEVYLRHVFSKNVLVFAISWLGSRDIYLAIIITVMFTLIVDVFLNDESDYSIVPENTTIKYTKQLDLDGDGKLSKDEIEKAKDILKRATKLENKSKHLNALQKFKVSDTYMFPN